MESSCSKPILDAMSEWAFNPLLLECLEEIQGKIKEELEVQDVPEISPVPVQCPISEISELSMPEDKK